MIMHVGGIWIYIYDATPKQPAAWTRIFFHQSNRRSKIECVQRINAQYDWFKYFPLTGTCLLRSEVVGVLAGLKVRPTAPFIIPWFEVTNDAWCPQNLQSVILYGQEYFCLIAAGDQIGWLRVLRVHRGGHHLIIHRSFPFPILDRHQPLETIISICDNLIVLTVAGETCWLFDIDLWSEAKGGCSLMPKPLDGPQIVQALQSSCLGLESQYIVDPEGCRMLEWKIDWSRAFESPELISQDPINWIRFAFCRRANNIESLAATALSFLEPLSWAEAIKVLIRRSCMHGQYHLLSQRLREHEERDQEDLLSWDDESVKKIHQTLECIVELITEPSDRKLLLLNTINYVATVLYGLPPPSSRHLIDQLWMQERFDEIADLYASGMGHYPVDSRADSSPLRNILSAFKI